MLKEHFRDSKALFTAALSKWSRSGNNDPERFVHFLPRKAENLCSASKRALILFVVARIGTPHQDSYFVEMTSKTILDGGFECGVRGVDMLNFDRGKGGEGAGR